MRKLKWSLRRKGTNTGMRFVTFGGNESSFALFACSSLVHSFDVKQVVLIWLQQNLLLAASDARDRPVSVWNCCDG